MSSLVLKLLTLVSSSTATLFDKFDTIDSDMSDLDICVSDNPICLMVYIFRYSDTLDFDIVHSDMTYFDTFTPQPLYPAPSLHAHVTHRSFSTTFRHSVMSDSTLYTPIFPYA